MQKVPHESKKAVLGTFFICIVSGCSYLVYNIKTYIISFLFNEYKVFHDLSDFNFKVLVASAELGGMFIGAYLFNSFQLNIKIMVGIAVFCQILGMTVSVFF